MKKLISLIIILFILSFCNTIFAANTFVTEGFETPGYENYLCDPNIETSCWTEYTDANCYIDDDYYCGGIPQDIGDYCLYTYSDGFRELAKTTWKLDEVSQDNVISVWIKLASHNLENTDQIQPIVLTTNAGSKLVIIKYYYYNGIIYIGATYNEGSGSTVYTPYYEIDADEWNLVKIRYSFSNLKFRLKVNGKLKYKANLYDTYPQNPRKLDLGVCYNNGTGSAEVLVRFVEWHD